MGDKQSFKDLFGTSDNSYVHYVDTVFEYTDLRKFTTLFAFDVYLNTYTNPILKKVDYNVVKARIDKKPDPANPSTAWESWQRDTIEISFDRQQPPQFTPTPASLVREITTGIQGIEYDDVKTSHVSANMFMDQIMFAIGKWKFTDFNAKLKANYEIAVNFNAIDTNLRTAVAKVGAIVGTTNTLILGELKQVCANALDYWVKDKPSELFLLTGLVDGQKFNETMIRNALREYIYKNLYLQAINEPDDAVLQYMKRILADMFIICFYPYIHYLYASQLQNYFIKRGDFINMRAATSAKIAVVLNSIQAIKDNVNTMSSQKFTSAEDSTLTAITNTINAYYANLSNPIFEEPTKTFGDVDVSVRELAKDVQTLNLSIDDLKKWIKETQLQIRSHTAIYKGIDGILQGKRVQYALHILFIVILVVVSGVMIKFNMYLDILLYVLTFIIVFFILVRLASVIISLL